MSKVLSRIKYHKWIMGVRESSHEIACHISIVTAMEEIILSKTE